MYQCECGKVFSWEGGIKLCKESNHGVKRPPKAKTEPVAKLQFERSVICAAIAEFFESMISEFSGTDDGCNVTLDDYTIEKGLRPYFEYYIKNKINI